ncbi:MAG: flagellar brake protein, partial [Thermodesulfobacteriota bacterium]|nr:flagellar brake protein [Thermodesulfobacteriota bacterium]
MDNERVTKKETRGRRLSLEIGDKIMARFEGQEAETKAKFIGMETGAYIVIRLPRITGLRKNLAEGNAVSLRYISSGMVYGFEAAVLGFFQEKNLNLVIISYPRAIETIDMRKEKRVDCYTNAKLTIAEEGFPGSLIDLSPSGCRFVFALSTEKTRPDFAIGQEATLSFRLPDLEGPQVFPCRIENIRHDGQTLSLGLIFDLKSETTFSFDVFRRFIEET